MGIGSFLATIDWDATGSMIQGLGTAGGAIAVYLAARLGFSAWRQQKLAERNRDQAEVVLQAAYNARRALRYVRSPFMTGHELTIAEEKLDDEQSEWRELSPPEKQKRLITCQAYYSRLHSFRDEQSALEDCLPMARALFDEELETAIEKLHHQFHTVRTYVDEYVDDHNGDDKDFTIKIRRALFASGTFKEGDENEISESIQSSMGIIEQTCLPYLRLETD